VILADDVAGVHMPHHRELEEVAGFGVDVGAGVDEDGIAREARQGGGDGRPVHAREHTQHEHADGHGGPGVPRRHERVALAVLDQLGGDAQR
jgi:hypothetical protein